MVIFLYCRFQDTLGLSFMTNFSVVEHYTLTSATRWTPHVRNLREREFVFSYPPTRWRSCAVRCRSSKSALFVHRHIIEWSTPQAAAVGPVGRLSSHRCRCNPPTGATPGEIMQCATPAQHICTMHTIYTQHK